MLLGVCLRVWLICLLFGPGNCFPTDHGNDTTLSSEPSANPDTLFTTSSAGNESASSIKAPEKSSDSNSTSGPGILLPRDFYVGPTSQPVEMSHGFSSQLQVVSGPEDFYRSPSPWFGPPLVHEPVYTGSDSHLYTYGEGSMRFPYYSYNGVHAAVPPYGYTHGTFGSPLYSYAYGTGEPSGQAYERNVHVAPPHGVSFPPAYGYFLWQPSVLEPEMVLIGNIMVKLREMPRAQPWRPSKVPSGLTEKPLVYQSSLMQSNGGNHRGKCLFNGRYFKDDYLSPTPEPETQQQDVTQSGY
ncbi:uncharacterized protein LOC119783522 [Cyprinodon tularosa]|uniref:uncharacterized protein LOC119783522 n=1 Tax=Cyprinodon tularosa TaxID=77115 RepID=UPI0018E1E688|nr:uncharacterized protein LOC119783522 [Cyprinodon tularosa]